MGNVNAAPRPDETKVASYSWYVLFVLVLVYVLNFVDRQILSILSEDIKRDLGLTDADLGFLYGTAFGVFYSIFGIPLGRLADNWHRVRLLVAGLSLWSLMTALSGTARSAGALAAARVGVGIGEATAGPCAYSLISDYFPRRLRATALAIYSGGLYVGVGLSLFVGGSIAQAWSLAYADGSAPFGLRGWQVAFFAVGFPGLLLALWVATLREPVRGQSDGLVVPPVQSASPFADFGQELLTVIPPLTIIGAARRGTQALIVNLAFAAAAAGVAYGLIRLTGDVPQWVAVGIGVYAVFSWATALRLRDPPAFALIFGSVAFLLTVIGNGILAYLSYSVTFWTAPYAMRTFGASPADAGLFVGGAGALGGFIGVVIGGRLADAWKVRNPSGRVLVMLIAAAAPIPLLVLSYTTTSLPIFYASYLPIQALCSCAVGAAGATVQDLVLPRMRGTATAVFLLASTLIGLALGPYVVGRISLATESLATGMLSLAAAAPVAIASFLLLYRLLPSAEASVLDRARDVGEPL